MTSEIPQLMGQRSSHAVSPSTARADAINDKCFIVL